MFINISNHPSSKWGIEQIEAAKKLGGNIIDIPFPNVSPNATKSEIFRLVDEIGCIVLEKTKELSNVIDYVHVMGEQGFVFSFVNYIHLFKNIFNNIICVHSTTERIVEEKDGQKVSTFKFVQFREY